MGILWLGGTPPPGLIDMVGGDQRADNKSADGAFSEAQYASHAAHTFEAIWDHYLRTRFIYPAKLERIEQALPTIRAGWPLLLRTKHELFQIHAAWEATQTPPEKPHTTPSADSMSTGADTESQAWVVSSSIATFRDTDDTYVIQHAASRNTSLMLRSIIQCLERINTDPSFMYNRMYYRTENAWPKRVTEVIEAASPPELTGRYDQAYLIAPFDAVVKPDDARDGSGDAAEVEAKRVGLRLRHMRADDAEAAHQIVLEATGSSVVTEALGFTRSALLNPSHAVRTDALHLVDLNLQFLKSGLRRTRRGLMVEMGQQPVGIALQYFGAVPMNFSFLDTRIEIHVSPRLPESAREQVVRQLASASLYAARVHGDPVAAVLVDKRDRTAVASAGFHDTGKSYASFLWQRENADGAPAGPSGIYELYHRVR